MKKLIGKTVCYNSIVIKARDYDEFSSRVEELKETLLIPFEEPPTMQEYEIRKARELRRGILVQVFPNGDYDFALIGPEQITSKAWIENAIGEHYLLTDGEVKQAIPHFRKSISYSDNYFWPTYHLAAIAGRSGSFQTAVELYEKALEINPDDQGVKRELEICRVELSKRRGR